MYRDDDQLETMDRWGPDRGAARGNWMEWPTMENCRNVNDGVAEVVRRYPERFVGLAHVPPLGAGAPGRDDALRGGAGLPRRRRRLPPRARGASRSTRPRCARSGSGSRRWTCRWWSTPTLPLETQHAWRDYDG